MIVTESAATLKAENAELVDEVASLKAEREVLLRLLARKDAILRTMIAAGHEGLSSGEASPSP